MDPPSWQNLDYRTDRRDYLKEIVPQNAVIGEIGVFLGQLTVQMLRELNPKVIHCIDPWVEYGEPGIRNNGAHIANQVIPALKRLDKVQVHVAQSQDIAGEFEDGYFDFLYIDGLHTYDQVTLDLDLYWPKVRVGGLIIGDDYAWQNSGVIGDRTAGCSVFRAVHDFVDRHKDECTLSLVCNQQYTIEKHR